MASKPISKFKTLSKLEKIFRPREKPTNPQSKTNPASAPEPVSEDATASLAEIPTPAAIITEPTIIIPETLNQSKIVKISLWDRAYDSLKEKEKKLVDEYEQLLSKELQIGSSPKNGIRDNNDEFYVKTENHIESDDHKIRLAQLEKITTNGLQQLDEKKAKYNIFGHEFVLRDQLTQATQFIQNIKGVIDDAVKASPEASLAWAGICVILPIFMNPSVAEEASRDGCLYITSRIHFYTKLESLLSASNRLKSSGLDVELEERLLTLYQLIIDFHIRTVRRVYLKRLARFKEDTVQHENWKGMIAKIQETEKIFSDDFKLAKDAAMGTTLEELNSNAEKLLTNIDSMLISLLEISRNTSTYYFQNEDSGIQFNTTGGSQNNVIGNGIQFSGVTFSGAVNFNRH